MRSGDPLGNHGQRAMADHSAGPSPQQAVMAGIMPGDPADYRTFQTAGGGRWGRARRDRSYCQGHCRRDQDCSSPAVTSSARHGTGWAGADTAFPSASMVTLCAPIVRSKRRYHWPLAMVCPSQASMSSFISGDGPEMCPSSRVNAICAIAGAGTQRERARNQMLRAAKAEVSLDEGKPAGSSTARQGIIALATPAWLAGCRLSLH